MAGLGWKSPAIVGKVVRLCRRRHTRVGSVESGLVISSKTVFGGIAVGSNGGSSMLSVAFKAAWIEDALFGITDCGSRNSSAKSYVNLRRCEWLASVSSDIRT